MQPVLDWFAPFVAKIKKFFLDILGLTEGKTAIAKGFMGFWAGTGTPSFLEEKAKKLAYGPNLQRSFPHWIVH